MSQVTSLEGKRASLPQAAWVTHAHAANQQFSVLVLKNLQNKKLAKLLTNL
jgi:hypothetical protein